MRAIETKQLTKHYGKSRGIDEVSLAVEKGDIFGFLGPNGAGKSTTIRCLLGMLHYDAGKASVLGYSVGKDQIEILKRVGYMPSEAMFYPSLRVSEVIKLAAEARGMDCRQEAERLCKKLEVNTSKRIHELSLGNRKKVSIVCAMQHKPELLIFDEPTSGLDPLMQEAFYELITESNKEGVTVFMSSHVLPEVKKYCRHVGIIKEGRLIQTDTVENLTKTGLRRVKVAGISDLPGMDGMKDIRKSVNELEFSYTGDVKVLLNMLQGMPVQDLLITEPSLEEVFMHFYEDGKGVQ
ncbi:MAG TPA: ABC transporter ATP-binding protein [Lachnospiraceae bacterium]|nr:ABC transporter ATP-binding protein [Lachnospiraceae bacterium]